MVSPHEYRNVLERALENPPALTADARNSVYRRAKALLIASMRALEPPASEERIQEESGRLDDIIHQLESTFENSDSAAPSFAGLRIGAGRRADDPPTVPFDGNFEPDESERSLPRPGRGLSKVRGAVLRRFEPADPTLPVIL